MFHLLKRLIFKELKHKMKHETFFTIVYNTYTRARRGKFAKKENRQN